MSSFILAAVPVIGASSIGALALWLAASDLKD